MTKYGEKDRPPEDNGLDTQMLQDRSGRTSKKERVAKIQIDKLAAIVKAGKYRGQLIFIGWTPEDKPALSTDVSTLSEKAREAFEFYRKGAYGYQIPEIGYSYLIPAEFNLSGELLNSPNSREDFVTVTITDVDGAEKEIKVGELEILEAIVAANSPFVNPSRGIGNFTGRIISSENLYSLIIRGYDYRLPEDTAYAVLFKPPTEGIPQEATFRAFVVDTLQNLIVNDPLQGDGNQRGYYNAALKLPKLVTAKKDRLPQPGPIGRFLFSNEDSASKFEKKIRNFFFEDKRAQNNEKTINLQALERSETKELFAIATTFRDIAKNYFRYHR